MDSLPALALGSVWLSSMIEPQPPAAPFSGLVALVSPVSSKKKADQFQLLLGTAALNARP
jgi:hypothetical protein